MTKVALLLIALSVASCATVMTPNIRRGGQAYVQLGGNELRSAITGHRLEHKLADGRILISLNGAEEFHANGRYVVLLHRGRAVGEYRLLGDHFCVTGRDFHSCRQLYRSSDGQYLIRPLGAPSEEAWPVLLRPLPRWSDPYGLSGR